MQQKYAQYVEICKNMHIKYAKICKNMDWICKNMQKKCCIYICTPHFADDVLLLDDPPWASSCLSWDLTSHVSPLQSCYSGHHL